MKTWGTEGRRPGWGAAAWSLMLGLTGPACGGDDVDAETDAATDTEGAATTGNGTDDPTTVEPDASTDDDATTTGACAPASIPERFIVFGDSILACSTEPGGKTGAGCSAKIVHEQLDSGLAPGLTYENAAVGGAVTADILGQMAGVDATGPGHAIVLIGIGGNDLQPFLLTSDGQAMSAFDELSTRLDESWEEILDWLYDDAHFPDGFTLIVDNQYNPFDDCTASPYTFMTPLKTELLGVYNDRVAERIEGEGNARLSDLYRAYLGHGHHWQTQECPYTEDGNEYWMIGGTDLIHPGTAGHAGIAVEVRAAIDDVYACE
jgi:lysophospholipase L1-like esterase